MRGLLSRCKVARRLLRGTTAAATATWTEEPAGYSVATDQTLGLARPAGTGWIIYQAGGNNTTLVSDETSEPISPPDALQVNIPSGYTGGGGNEHQSYSLDSLTWREVFIGQTFKLSSNFDGTGSSGVQKLDHLWGYRNSGVASMIVPAAFGTGTSFTFQVRCQNFQASSNATVDPDGDGSFNLTSGNGGTGQSTALSRGVWHRFGLQCIYNTGSNADGVIRAWLNGVKVIEVTNLVINTSGTKRWYDLGLNPTHFDSGWTSGATMAVSFGHCKISGKA